MALNPDSIYKALRPVPEFDGNPNVLTRFIKICDQLVLQYVRDDPSHELSNLCLINGILNKITGSAARTINSNGIPDNWQGIRDALINNFSDQRDETALYNDMSLLTQGSSTPQEYYDKCQTLFSTIMTYITLHENIGTTIEAKRVLYKKLTLQSFVRGLKEPLGSRIRCMRPETIEKALEFVQQELNVMYLQQRNESIPERRNPNTHQMHANHKIPHAVPMTTPKGFSFPSAGSSWHKPMPPQQQQPWRPPFQHNQIGQRAPNMFSRTQQMFRAPPPNYNLQSSVFKLPPRNPQAQYTGPKPMSGVSHFVSKPLGLSGHDWRKTGNPPPSNYFKSREVNFNEMLEHDDNYNYSDYYYEQPDYCDYNDYYDYYNYDQTELDYYSCEPDNGQCQDANNSNRLEVSQPSTSKDNQDFQKDKNQKPSR